MKKVSLFLAACMVLTLTIMIAAYADETWTCENGHEGNTGKFCTECGAQKPEQAETWTCVNGHEGNTGNFCAECGSPKPVGDTWTCKNGHEGNTGNFCATCGAKRSQDAPEQNTDAGTPAQEVQTEPVQAEAAEPEEPAQEETVQQEPAQQEPPQTEAAAYDNPFPEEISQFTTAFYGNTADHQVALAEVLSHADPSDEIYLEYESTGKASENLAWDKYTGTSHDLYLVYQNGGNEVYAYVYELELESSQRVDWASGTLFPNPLNAVSSVLWVESDEDNDLYSLLLDLGSDETDYDGVKELIRSLDGSTSAQWFSHRISMMREETDSGKDRYWVIYHNTEI